MRYPIRMRSPGDRSMLPETAALVSACDVFITCADATRKCSSAPTADSHQMMKWRMAGRRSTSLSKACSAGKSPRSAAACRGVLTASAAGWPRICSRQQHRITGRALGADKDSSEGGRLDQARVPIESCCAVASELRCAAERSALLSQYELQAGGAHADAQAAPS